MSYHQPETLYTQCENVTLAFESLVEVSSLLQYLLSAHNTEATVPDSMMHMQKIFAWKKETLFK